MKRGIQNIKRKRDVGKEILRVADKPESVAGWTFKF